MQKAYIMNRCTVHPKKYAHNSGFVVVVAVVVPIVLVSCGLAPCLCIRICASLLHCVTQYRHILLWYNSTVIYIMPWNGVATHEAYTKRPSHNNFGQSANRKSFLVLCSKIYIKYIYSFLKLDVTYWTLFWYSWLVFWVNGMVWCVATTAHDIQWTCL